MIPERRIPTHPGTYLLEEYLRPLGVTQAAFAAHIGVSARKINEIVLGKRKVDIETAWLLSKALKTTPEFWLNLQMNYDLVRNRPKRVIKPLHGIVQTHPV